jgi:hypothetical protein
MTTQTAGRRLGRTLGLTALVGLTIAGAVAPLGAQAAGRTLPKAKHAALVSSREYQIVALSAGTPNTMQVKDLVTGAGPITVSLSPTAVIVRRYNGKSSFSELSVNDRITVAPLKALGLTTAPAATTPISPTTAPVQAMRIKDFSIQVAYTQIAGTITGITPDFSQVTLTVTASKGHNVAAFMVGQSVTLDLTSTTPVFLGKTASTTASLKVGMTVRTSGLSDSVTGVMAAPHAIHIVPAKAATATDPGTPSDGTPA